MLRGGFINGDGEVNLYLQFAILPPQDLLNSLPNVEPVLMDSI